jgi:hypothetical protein
MPLVRRAGGGVREDAAGLNECFGRTKEPRGALPGALEDSRSGQTVQTNHRVPLVPDFPAQG